MRKTMTSLSVYVLVLFFTNVLGYRIDSPKSKPVYGKKILVSNYSNNSQQV